MPLLGHDRFVIPISAFDQAYGNAAPMLSGPAQHAGYVCSRIAQISLQRNSTGRAFAELAFSKNAFEELEGEIFQSVVLHIEINECPEFFGTSQYGTQAVAHDAKRSLGI